MKERPILFSAPMVRAILAGKKTQTRRVCPRDWWRCLDPDDPEERARGIAMNPYGVPGDRLWVRETHCVFQAPGDCAACAYRATCPDDPHFEYVHGDGSIMRLRVTKWTPSIHMPRWASRITLEVTGVRVERLQDISGEDARAEGISEPRCDCEPCQRTSAMCPADASVHIESYARLWDAINGKRCPWSSNPWVWVVEFRRAQK